MYELKELYNEVFDATGNVKNCKREKCKLLIKAMEREYPGVDFGRSEKGIMHTINIQKYYNKSSL